MSDSILYVVSRFPKLTETFVVNEMIAVEKRFDVRLAALHRTRERRVQREAARFLGSAWFLPVASAATARAHGRYLVRDLRTYLSTLIALLRETRRPYDLVTSIVVFVKAVRLAAIAEDAGIAHVHAHFANHPTTAAWIVHRLTGRPFSFTAHANDLVRRTSLLERKLAAAQFVVAISEYNAALLREMREHAPVHVVHCGVDVARFRPRDPHRRTEPTARILCVASFEPKKGHRFLLEAIAALVPRVPKLELVLVGEGPERRDVETLARTLGIEARTSFLGARPSDVVASELGRASVFALPSIRDRSGRIEGIPVALMEAMAAGVPVVTTRHSGIPELVADGCGVLVEPGDAIALADAIARLLDDRGLADRCAERGRARVMDEFDLFSEARRLGDLFAASISNG